MRFDLAAMARATRPNSRRPAFIAAAITPTKVQRDNLQRIYMRVVREWGRLAREQIMPRYEQALRDAPAVGDALIVDSPQDVRDEMESAGSALNRLVLTLEADLENWVVRIEEWHRGRFGQSFTPIGVRLDTMLGQGDVATTLQAVLGENTALIRSLNDQLRNGISGHVFRGLTERATAADVARAIRKETGIAARRAELIAADQLQKLTGRLDQERQEQVGISKFEWAHSRKANPREEHVARNGKIYAWDSPVAKNDPPGRAIRCGCRARAYVELDEEAEAAEQEAVPPPPPPLPPAPPVPAARGFTSPINPNVTAETIPVAPRLQVQKEMAADFARANGDSRYSQLREFSARQPKDFGNASFNATFNDEAVSALRALKPELDNLADQIGIPRLRGFKSITGNKAAGDMGDGVMGINPSYFNGYTSRVGGRAPTDAADELKAQREVLKQQLQPLVDRIRTLRASSDYEPWGPEETDLFKRVNKIRAADDRLWKRESALKHTAAKPDATGSTWKPGDDVKKRPYTMKSYHADGLEQARSLLFHEFGHHVHQYLKKQGSRRQFGTPPLERDLATYYRQAMFANKSRQPTTYSTSNQHEWFAENFSAFVHGRRDLVDPIALKLIERIFRGEY